MLFKEDMQGGATGIEQSGCMAAVVAGESQDPADSIDLRCFSGRFQGGQFLFLLF